MCFSTKQMPDFLLKMPDFVLNMAIAVLKIPGFCAKNVVFCCKEWFHPHCAGLTVQQVDDMTSSSTDDDEYRCRRCQAHEHRHEKPPPLAQDRLNGVLTNQGEGEDSRSDATAGQFNYTIPDFQHKTTHV